LENRKEKMTETPRSNTPVSTQWVLDAAGECARIAIDSIYMVVCSRTSSKGTGFLLRNGYIITNEHVVRGCAAHEIVAHSSCGDEVSFSGIVIDVSRDLVALKPTQNLSGGLALDTSTNLQLGAAVSTWGFPLGYNGPAPLLSVGYLSGFQEYQAEGDTLKHLVVNGAFNPGNSGGPLFLSDSSEVVGVVVSKHAPISSFLMSALEALQNNESGLQYTASDGQGNTKTYSEAQVVAELLFYFRKLTQVMIGEAIAAEELVGFLVSNGIELPE